MNYEDAKKQQLEEFKNGRYFVIRQYDDTGEYELVQTTSRAVAQDSIQHDVVAVVKRLPTRLRMLK